MQENTNKTLGFYTFLYFEAVFFRKTSSFTSFHPLSPSIHFFFSLYSPSFSICPFIFLFPLGGNFFPPPTGGIRRRCACRQQRDGLQEISPPFPMKMIWMKVNNTKRPAEKNSRPFLC